MDIKRVVLASAICFFILLGYQYLARYMGWMPATQTRQTAIVDSPDGAGAEAVPSAAAPAARPGSEVGGYPLAEGREIRVETPLYTAVLHSSGGVLQSFVLKEYKDRIGADGRPMQLISPESARQAPMGLIVSGQPSWSEGQWDARGGDIVLEAGQTGSLTFSGVMHGILMQRVLTFSADTYEIGEVTSLSTESVPVVAKLGYNIATSFMRTSSNYDAMTMAWDIGGSLEKEKNQKDLTSQGVSAAGEIYWGGVMSNYFLAAVIPAVDTGSVYKGRLLEDGVWRASVEAHDLDLAPGSSLERQAGWWFGPKDRDLLNTAANELSDAVDMGWMSFLAYPLLYLLNFFQSFVGNWGVAILLLTILIKILFWPLTRKSYTSMDKMKKLQPMIKQLQEKHGSNKEVLSRETMQLYKSYGVNPMGGCLPILIQIPVFIALYQALLHAIELRHAVFVANLPFTDITWLADLSVKDPFYITPLIMGATMFLQQWMSPSVGDPTQRKIMMLMPLIFVFMFLQFPSGLVLYWLCNNVLSIFQQWWTMRKAK